MWTDRERHTGRETQRASAYSYRSVRKDQTVNDCELFHPQIPHMWLLLADIKSYCITILYQIVLVKYPIRVVPSTTSCVRLPAVASESAADAACCPTYGIATCACHVCIRGKAANRLIFIRTIRCFGTLRFEIVALQHPLPGSLVAEDEERKKLCNPQHSLQIIFHLMQLQHQAHLYTYNVHTQLQGRCQEKCQREIF